MSDNTEEKEKLLDAFEKKLNIIISQIEEKKSTQLIDILTAILLSLATIASAWCAYQSTLWGGVQTFELAAVAKAGRLSSENLVKANQKRMFDGIVMMKYIDASEEGNIRLKDFYFNRFDSVLRNATLEWIELDPFNNQNVPNSPMRMKSYQLKEEIEAFAQLDLSTEKLASANEAKRNSNEYVLLTVLFTGVLFFGGIASTLRSRMFRNLCMLLSAIIFCITLFVLINMPYTNL